MKRLAILAVIATLTGCLDVAPETALPTAWLGELEYATPGSAGASAALTDTVDVFVHFESDIYGDARAVVSFYELDGSDECHIWFLPLNDPLCFMQLEAKGTHYDDFRDNEMLVLSFNVPMQEAAPNASAWPEHCAWSGFVTEDNFAGKEWLAILRCGDAGTLRGTTLWRPVEG